MGLEQAPTRCPPSRTSSRLLLDSASNAVSPQLGSRTIEYPIEGLGRSPPSPAAPGGMGLPGAASGRPPGSMLGHLFESLATLCIRVPGPFGPEQEKNQL